MKYAKMLLLLLVLGGAGFAIYRWWTKPAAPPVYNTSPATLAPIEESVTATGTLSALTTVVVGSQVSGIVKALHVDYNDTVTKGQLLAELDPATFETQVKQAKAELAAARVAVSNAKQSLEDTSRAQKRAEELSGKSLIADSELEAARSAALASSAAVKSAEAQVVRAQAALEQAQLNLERAKIFSPIDGLVINRAVDVGQTVAASLSAPELFSLAEDLRKMRVIANVGEADVGKLTEGMPATFTVDAFPGRTFTGSITQIRYNPTTTNGVVTYAAVIVVANEDLKLRPGMTANVKVTSERREQALVVPNTALRFTPPNVKRGSGEKSSGAKAEGKPAAGDKKLASLGDAPKSQELAPGTTRGRVYVKDGDELRSVPVVVGLNDGQQSEIVSGDLKEGDEVVLSVEGGASNQSNNRGSRGPGMRF